MSDFLSEDQQMMRDVARKFARNEIEPLAVEIDETERTPKALFEKCAELGFFGAMIPEEYGGSNLGLTTSCAILHEIAKASPSVAGLLAVEMVLCPLTVIYLGTEDQKQRLLAKSASGERLLAYSATEPTGGADPVAFQTRLAREGEAYVLNGSKLFCSQGEAKTLLVICRTERDGQKGIGVVIVEKEASGVSPALYEKKLGWRGTNTGGITYTEVLVPQENVLGDLLTAYDDHFIANTANFIAHSVTSIGAVEGLFDKTLEHVKERRLYGKPMATLSPVSDRMAVIYSKIQACKSMAYNAARLFDDGRIVEHLALPSCCKSYICDTAFECTTQLLQMWGGMGIMDSTGLHRYMRDARTNMVAEGSSEIHNALISSLGLGLLEEPFGSRNR